MYIGFSPRNIVNVVFERCSGQKDVRVLPLLRGGNISLERCQGQKDVRVLPLRSL